MGENRVVDRPYTVSQHAPFTSAALGGDQTSPQADFERRHRSGKHYYNTLTGGGKTKFCNHSLTVEAQ
jgi:hypothetical protein